MNFLYSFTTFEYQVLEDYLNHKASLGYELKSCHFLTFKQSDQYYYYFVNPKELTSFDEDIIEVGNHHNLYIYRSKKPIHLKHDEKNKPLKGLLINLLLLIGAILFIYFVTPNGPFFVKLLAIMGLDDQIPSVLVQYSYLLFILGLFFFGFKKVIMIIHEFYCLIKQALKQYHPTLTSVFIRSLITSFFSIVGFIFCGLAILSHIDFEKEVLINSHDYPILTKSRIDGDDKEEILSVKMSSTPFCKQYIEYIDEDFSYALYEMNNNSDASFLYRILVKRYFGENDTSYTSEENRRYYQFGNIISIYKEDQYVVYLEPHKSLNQSEVENIISKVLSHS